MKLKSTTKLILQFLHFLAIVVKMTSSSSVSLCRGCRIADGTIPVSANNSNQELLSSSYFSTSPTLATNSAFERARQASRYLLRPKSPNGEPAFPTPALQQISEVRNTCGLPGWQSPLFVAAIIGNPLFLNFLESLHPS